MTVKAKRFRIGVEGATTDGREIQREWLEQMAASYNPAVYTALINLEHIKSYLPDSTFNRYGKVTALFAEEITEGPLAGKMALYADVEPTESLVELVKKGQKLFTSMEVSPKFADTGKAYLVGLAATDDPASLGTEMLTFSASAAHNPLANRKQNPANLFRCSAQSDRSCGYCTGRRGAGCLEILATHQRISRWRGGRIQSGGWSRQCSIRTT